MQGHGIADAFWLAVRRRASVPSGIGATIAAVVQKGWLLPAALACTLIGPWSAHAGSSYLAVWSSDKEPVANSLITDFLAIIDADPRSPTYGKVVNTASLQHVPGTNLLNDLGLTGPLGLTTQYGFPATGIPSDALNEAHHMTHDPIVVGGRRYLYLGGLISANVFRCDVTDPLHIPTCPLVTSAKEVKNFNRVGFSGVDDFKQAPNGNLFVTYMGAEDLTTPGGLVELALDGTVVGEYAAAKQGGPPRYMPSINGVTDTGLLAHPHGLDFRQDLNLLVTSDYADPLSLATAATLFAATEDCGTTVRFWDLSDLTSGPTAIAQVPVGNGREALFENNAPEGVMSLALTHLYQHKGVFAASMGGGAIYYAPDATAAQPEFRMVYRVGPGSSPGVFFITPDDRFLVQPIAGAWSPGDAVYNRDYSGEHSRRVIALDIRKLLRAGTDVQCDAPPVVTDAAGVIEFIPARNNGADDCPTVSGTLNQDSQANYDTHGGPHVLAYDHETRRVAAANYFVQLTPFNLPGTHEAGDDRVCMARLTPTGQLVLDTAFKDELTGLPCVSMDRPTSYVWPHHGATGAAKPHLMAFIDLDWEQN
jgi:hypothetical protein